jgi:protein NrfC
MSNKELTRRDFIKMGSTTLAALGLGTLAGGWFDLGDGVIAIAASEGYLVVDTKKCAACKSCMLACSLTHHGRENLALSRIQIIDDPFAGYPNDITINQCRQCPSAPCVEVCPTYANHSDKKNGNIRLIDPEKCIGCQKCVEACPHTPSRVIWNFEDKHAQKCDLCVNTPHWEEKGGIGGKQACVSVCPMRAIKFTKEIPVQSEGGYNVNLRNENYGWIGLPTD